MDLASARPADVAMERLLAPLDVLRRGLISGLGAWGRRLAVERETRIAQLGALGFGLVLALSLAGPWWLLAWGPLVLGVPHLVADVRYLVVTPRLHQRMWVVVALAVACGLAASGWLVAGSSVALVAGVVVARASIGFKSLGIVIASAAAAGLSSWDAAPVFLAHAHNLVALVVLVAWKPARMRTLLAPLGVVVAGLGILGVQSVLQPLSDVLEPYARTLAPGVDGPLATFAVTSFAFLQAVHYATWLRLLPDRARPRETPRSFRKSWISLRSELGALPALALLLGLVLFAWGLVDVVRADTAYFRIALFHGPLELFALALAATERRALSNAGNASFAGERDTPRPA